MESRLPLSAVSHMVRHTQPTTQGIIRRMQRSAPVLCSLLSAFVLPSRGALPPLTSCAGMSPTNIVLVQRIGHSTSCLPAPPVRCRGHVYELWNYHQTPAAPGRHVECT